MGRVLFEQSRDLTSLFGMARSRPGSSAFGADIQIVGGPGEPGIGDPFGKLKLVGVIQRPREGQTHHPVEGPRHVRYARQQADHAVPVPAIGGHEGLPDLGNDRRHARQRTTHVFRPTAGGSRTKRVDLLEGYRGVAHGCSGPCTGYQKGPDTGFRPRSGTVVSQPCYTTLRGSRSTDETTTVRSGHARSIRAAYCGR